MLKIENLKIDRRTLAALKIIRAVLPADAQPVMDEVIECIVAELVETIRALFAEGVKTSEAAVAAHQELSNKLGAVAHELGSVGITFADLKGDDWRAKLRDVVADAKRWRQANPNAVRE